MEPRKPSFHETNGLAHTNHPRYRGLVGHWIMNESGGATIYDLSGSSYNGTLTNVTWTQGPFGPATNYNGTTSSAAFGDINALDGLSALTVEMSFTPRALADFAHFINKRPDAATSGWSVQDGGSGFGDNNDMIFLTSGGSATFGHTTGNFLAVGQTTHFVGVFDGAGADNPAKLKIYINGLSRTLGYLGTIPTSITANAYQLYFGRSGDDGEGRGNLDIHYVRIWTRALSADEVWSLYADPFLEWAYPVDDEWNTIAAAGIAIPVLTRQYRERWA